MERRENRMTTPDTAGLSSKQATKLLFAYGENKLESGKKISPLKIFGGQFKDLMTLILLISTVVSVLMGEASEAIAIIVIVLVNAILGFIQEFRTERTLEALRNMSAPTANVMRDGRATVIPAHEIVPGDVILLKSGDKVPADARLLEVVALQCDESLLSGESLSVEKIVCETPLEDPEAGRIDHVYAGTVITKGRGSAEVVATGMHTEMGKIAGMLHEIEDEPTQLQKRLTQLGKYIAFGCLGICAVVTLTGILRGEDLFDMLLVGISLAVAAVPEGLPAVVTIALALAVNRILKRNALVRRLHSVETLGCANVICTDKTGTLTENRMTVRKIFTMNYDLDVSGNGYEQAGTFTCAGRRAATQASPTLVRLVDIAAACNNAQLTAPSGMVPGRDRSANTGAGSWTVNGEPTEVALLVMAAKAGVEQGTMQYQRMKEIPFDSDRKRMTVFVQDKLGHTMAFVKGAPDFLLERCKYVLTDHGVQVMTPAIQNKIAQVNQDMAKQALRVLGFACKESPRSDQDAEQDMVFVGLAGMIDPPRKEAYDAVARCRQAHIRTVMITGDHRDTAVAIAKDLGILRSKGMVLTGHDLDHMSDEELDLVIKRVNVFARVNPGHKLRIVRALKARGDIVAMTGDGVNDAPAIKEADIGVAMGIAGTDVTKQAASIILLDDNFATLVASIEEGRVVYSNIRKFIRYLISCNIGEVVTMFVGMLMGMPVILLPIQILLVNLVTDGLPAMALSLEPAEPGIMGQKPRPAGESVFSNGLLTTIIFRGMIIGFTTLAVFSSFMRKTADIDVARTGALVMLVITQLFHVFECKSETKSIFQINLFRNKALMPAVGISIATLLLAIYHPAMQAILSTVALSVGQLAQILLYASITPVLSAIWMMIPHKSKTDIALPMTEAEA